MSPVEVFQNEELATRSEALTHLLLAALTGQMVDVGLASLFAVFQGICKNQDRDAGMMFDEMLALMEGRKASTHAAPKLLQ